MEEASGSIPLSSTPLEPAESLAHWVPFLAGLVAAEGCFSSGPRGAAGRRFVFSVEMAERDAELVAALRSLLGAGSLHRRRPRKANHQASVCLTINSRRAGSTVVAPFFGHHLAVSAKRDQFERWAAELAGVVPVDEVSRAPIAHAPFLAGFVAGEGSFVRSGRRFRFAVAVADEDIALLERLRATVGAGDIDRLRPRKTGQRPTAVFRVGGVRDLLGSVVPFMSTHLLPSYKREQFDRWAHDLEEFWRDDMRRARQCCVEGCLDARRAKGLCRHHYFEQYRR
jgi:hypothetical protein